MLKKYRLILLCSLSLCLQSCTITPKPIAGTTINFDSSTPIQYNNQNAGFIGFRTYTNNYNVPVMAGLLTKGGRSNYNLLIDKYSAQWKKEKAKTLNVDDGITTYIDSFGNQLYEIDPEHLAVFLTLSAWIRSGL